MKSLKIQGRLLFQETHSLESNHYITSVFDDADKKRFIISSYGLDISEFPELFKHSPILFAPENDEAVFHQIVRRLRIVSDPLNESRSLTIVNDLLPENMNDSPREDRPTSSHVSDGFKFDLLNCLTRKSESVILKSKQLMLRLESRSMQAGYRWHMAPSNDNRNPFAGSQETLESSNHLKVHDKTVKRVLIKKVSHNIEGFEKETVYESMSLFSEGNKYIAERLKESSRIIRKHILDFRAEKQERHEQILQYKLRDLNRFQEMSSARSEAKQTDALKQAALNERRSANIRCKQRDYDHHVNATFVRRKSQAVLENKKFQIRILIRRSQIIEQLTARWIEKRNNRLNLAKRQAKRDRNMEKRVQERQRKVLEDQWTNERRGDGISSYILGMTEPKINAAASVIESIKTSKTGSSAAVARKLQQELIREKAEFLDRLDRSDRIRGKLLNKPVPKSTKSPEEIEVERFQAWKAARLSNENRILNAKLRQTILRKNEQAQYADDLKSKWEWTRALDASRLLNWEKFDRRNTAYTVERAYEDTSPVCLIVPCLAI